MSSGPDDIVFEEVAYREPRRLRRPDRDLKFACLAYESPSPDDLPSSSTAGRPTGSSGTP